MEGLMFMSGSEVYAYTQPYLFQPYAELTLYQEMMHKLLCSICVMSAFLFSVTLWMYLTIILQYMVCASESAISYGRRHLATSISTSP